MSESAAPTKYCTNCGAPVHPEAKFCSACAHPTGDATPTSQGPSQPSPSHHTYSRKENPVTQGMKLGTTGCVGCITFVVLALILIALAAHH